MNIHYYPESDSLYIDLADRPGTEVIEAAPGVNLDIGAEGHVVGIDIQHASEVADLSRIDAVQLPVVAARGH